MNNISKWLLLPLIAISTFLQCTLAFANNQQYERKALQFFESLKSDQPEKIYSFLSDDLKKEVSLEQLKPVVLQLKRIANNAESIKLMKSETNVRGIDSYGLIYTFISTGIPYEYQVHLVESKRGVFIRGFDFFATVPDKLFSFKYATYKHYMVFSAFTACIIAEMACLLVFIFRRGLKRRWLYALSAFVGTPIGIGINWITGALTVSFGFYIPAVRVQWPDSNPNMPSIFAFFPLCVIFLAKILVFDRKENNRRSTNESNLRVHGDAPEGGA